MRLLIVSQYFWPENFRINDLAVEFVRRGHEVTVLTGLPNYPEGKIFQTYLDNQDFYRNFNGVEIVRVPIVSRGSKLFRLIVNYLSFVVSASILGIFKLRKKHYDVIFTCQLSPITIAIPAIIFRKIKKAPMALWVLDLWPDSLQAAGAIKSGVVIRLLNLLAKYIYLNSDLILTQSRSFLKRIGSMVGEHKNLEYFPSWAETIFDEESSVTASEVPPSLGKFNIMFAGNIGYAQDFPAILSAAELLKSKTQIRWLIVGEGRLANWVRVEIARRNLQEHVIMLGSFPLERMRSFYDHADALLVSLRPDPIFGLTIPGKLQSYLAAGVPVLAMLDGEGADVIQRSGCGLVSRAGDYKGLASNILDMFNLSDEERREMGMKGKHFSISEFGRVKLFDRLERSLMHLRRENILKNKLFDN